MLITIIVITYNSSRYVLETLESAFRQTYKDVELIISDDCSTDNTLSLCEEWVEKHRARFVDCKVVKTYSNSGICHNYNHALRYAKGEYIKYIAGDDVLKDNAVERYVANIRKEVNLYFSGAERIFEDGTKCCLYYECIPNGSARMQLKTMLRRHPLVFGPCIFVERQKLIALGGFDEAYPMSEDYPILMKYLTHGERCFFIEEPLVGWRMHGDSVSCANKNDFKDSVKKSVLHYSFIYSWIFCLFFTPYHDWLDFWIPEHYAKGKKYRILGYLLRCIDLVHLKYKVFGRPQDCIVEYI